MAMGRIKHIHFALLLGISLIIPFFLAYSLYADLSETTLLSSDMSLEDPDDGDLSTCPDEVKVFLPTVSSNPLSSWIDLGHEANLISTPLTYISQNKPVLRC